MTELGTDGCGGQCSGEVVVAGLVGHGVAFAVAFVDGLDVPAVLLEGSALEFDTSQDFWIVGLIFLAEHVDGDAPGPCVGGQEGGHELHEIVDGLVVGHSAGVEGTFHPEAVDLASEVFWSEIGEIFFDDFKAEDSSESGVFFVAFDTDDGGSEFSGEHGEAVVSWAELDDAFACELFCIEKIVDNI